MSEYFGLVNFVIVQEKACQKFHVVIEDVENLISSLRACDSFTAHFLLVSF